jgi:hypothetical protein
VCPGEESPFSELVIHVDRRPQPAIPSGDQETRTDSSDASRSLAGRRAAPARERALRGLMLVDVVGLEREGAVEVTVNDSTFVPHLGAMFDGDTAWPSRSDSVNPLVIDFAFQRPIRLAAVRVFLVGSTYQWVAEARAGERWSRQSVPSDEWSQIDLRPPVETAAVRLELLRLLRDDNVHVSEIELYTTPP